MNFEFFMPTRLIFGPGKVKEVGVNAKALGKKALIVTGKSSAKKAGYLDVVAKSLEQEKIDWVLFDEVEPNPLTTTVERGAKLARDTGADFVVGLGGGSAMDTAKGIAFATLNEGPLADYIAGKRGGDALPIVLITTTAGTGSEANNYAVFTNPETKVKKSLKSPGTYARFSIIDPELMLTVPKKVTASTGIDVFFHAMEAYVGKRSQPFTDALALEAIRLVAENLKGACEHGDDIQYRERMAWANTLAGVAINLSGTCGIHGMGHPLSGIYDVPHGESLSAVSLAFMRFNIPEAPGKFAKVAEALGVDVRGLTLLEAAEKSVQALKDLMDSIEVPQKISAFGITEKDIDALAEHTCKWMTHNLEASPRVPAIDDVKKMYRESL
ncbi:MAG TPA: iron-containing alcohol dehydrogenase [Thermoanaerobacterales bacterium]|nr:iron-containing alcohol dehydrogenase [Thermoanaerobacterales bacterium]